MVNNVISYACKVTKNIPTFQAFCVICPKQSCICLISNVFGFF